MGLRCCTGFSPVVAIGGSSPAVVCGLLTVVTRCRAQALEHAGFSGCGSRALEHKFRSCGTQFSCCKACRIFPGQGPIGRQIPYH